MDARPRRHGPPARAAARQGPLDRGRHALAQGEGRGARASRSPARSRASGSPPGATAWWSTPPPQGAPPPPRRSRSASSRADGAIVSRRAPSPRPATWPGRGGCHPRGDEHDTTTHHEGHGRVMCGVIGYVGRRHAKERLLKGLERLEYRGYDSAGICLVNGDGLDLGQGGRQAREPQGQGQRARLRRDDRDRPHALGDPRPRDGAERPSARRPAITTRSRSSSTASSRTTRSCGGA